MPAAYAKYATIAVICLSLTACAAGSTAISKRNLDVQTRMTDTVFLDPVSPDQRTIFIEVRNTSDRQDFDLEQAVVQRIETAGYTRVDDPARAQFMLQANVLQAGRNTDTAADDAFGGGFGSVLTGGAIGGAAGYGLGQAGGSDVGLTIGGAILGAAIATAADAFVQDVTYTAITDLRISERAPGDVVISQSEDQELDQGSGGSVRQSSSTVSPWKHYQTRIVSEANKVNLDFPEAAPELADGIARSIAGVF